MSPDIAIQVRNLGKQYRIGTNANKAENLRTAIVGAIAAPFRTSLRNENHDIPTDRKREEIWALNDISFDVTCGEVLGIIGRNGAGKSTLLKVLSRITTPTRGSVSTRGRIASLLEVGTGFHPELTGRENVYLNGSILGLAKTEIDRLFDEIVDFAGISMFIDTPIKRFSSGMQVRLAFAVAAHLQPEILLIDEVLAVGDIEFQKKCINRVDAAKRAGRTVLIVSHNLTSIKALCSRAILLQNGSVEVVGDVDVVIDAYQNSASLSPATIELREESDSSSMPLKLTKVRLANSHLQTFAVRWQEDIILELTLEATTSIDGVALGIGVRTIDGAPVFTVQHDDKSPGNLYSFRPGEQTVNVTIANILRPGIYRLHIGADYHHLRMRPIFASDSTFFEVLGYSTDGRHASVSNEGVVNGCASWQRESWSN